MDFDWLPAVMLVGLPAGILTLVVAVIPKIGSKKVREEIGEELL